MIRKAAVLLAFLFFVVTLAYAAPTVRKVDPPNWYIGRGNPLLLIYGDQLDGAQVVTNSPMAKVRNTEVSANGHYLIVQLDLLAAAQPGAIALVIKSPRGETTISYPIRAHRNIADGLKGLSSTD